MWIRTKMLSARVLVTGVVGLAGVTGLLGLNSCKKEPPPPPAKPGATPGGMSGGRTGAGGQADRSLRGQVLETMDSGGYTYLKLKTRAGVIWAAVRKAQVTRGQRVAVANPQLMENFRSKTLNRTFQRIWFGSLARGRRGPGRRGGHGGRSPGAVLNKAHSSTKFQKAKFDKPLPKAPGPDGRTVAELFAQRKALAGKTVTVRGKVTKVSKNIMGRNWIHLQDGTGTETEFDLTATSQATAKVGDLVLVKGTVRADKNVGGGYFYKVLLEDATIQPSK